MAEDDQGVGRGRPGHEIHGQVLVGQRVAHEAAVELHEAQASPTDGIADPDRTIRSGLKILSVFQQCGLAAVRRKPEIEPLPAGQQSRRPGTNVQDHEGGGFGPGPGLPGLTAGDVDRTRAMAAGRCAPQLLDAFLDLEPDPHGDGRIVTLSGDEDQFGGRAPDDSLAELRQLRREREPRRLTRRQGQHAELQIVGRYPGTPPCGPRRARRGPTGGRLRGWARLGGSAPDPVLRDGSPYLSAWR